MLLVLHVADSKNAKIRCKFSYKIAVTKRQHFILLSQWEFVLCDDMITILVCENRLFVCISISWKFVLNDVLMCDYIAILSTNRSIVLSRWHCVYRR